VPALNKETLLRSGSCSIRPCVLASGALNCACRWRSWNGQGSDVAWSRDSETLGRYPYPVVRIACRYCKRRGRYQLVRLVETHGPYITCAELLTRLSADCALSSNRTNRPGCRGAYLPDVEKD
jgi:hypothetical protein